MKRSVLRVTVFFCSAIFMLLYSSCSTSFNAGDAPDSLNSSENILDENENKWSLRYLYHFEDGKDSLRLLMYFGKESTLNYHRIEASRVELQRKKNNSSGENDLEAWETIQMEESVQSDHDTLRFLGMYGDYAVFENEGITVYSGGYMDHYLSYTLVRNQKLISANGFSQIIEHDNHATSECIQSLDQNNGCDCIRTFGTHSLSYDSEKRQLLFEFKSMREWGVEKSCKDTAGMGAVDVYKALCEGDSCMEYNRKN